MVVLPVPLRPTSTIFSPRLMMPLKSSITSSAPCAFEMPSNSSAVRPDGRRLVNLMYGR